MTSRWHPDESTFLYRYYLPAPVRVEDVEVEESTNWDVIANLIEESDQLILHPSVSRLREKHEKGYHFFLAWRRGNPVGVIAVNKIEFYTSVVKYLYVSQRVRRQGIGSALLEKATMYAHEEIGTPVAECTSIAENRAVRGLKRSLGYRPVGRFESPMSDNVLVLWVHGTQIAGVI